MMKCPPRLWLRFVRPICSSVCLIKAVNPLRDRIVMLIRYFIFYPSSLQIQGIKLMVRWLLGVKNNQSKSGNSTLRMLTAILHSDGDLTEQGRMG